MNLVLAAMPYFAEYELGRAALTTVLIAPAVLTTPLLIAAVAVLGVAFAAMQPMPLSMVPDVISAAGPNCGASAGSYTGPWAAAEATGGTLGPYLYSGCLAAGGFVASTAGEHTTQSSGAVAAVRYGFTLVPAVLTTIAIVLQRRYTLDQQAHTAAPSAVAQEKNSGTTAPQHPLTEVVDPARAIRFPRRVFH
ncbi:MFS transporter [Streptomyces sp. NPDC020951]|uniref:MFS transporter n=1 Tax=Streptomyces sp. NPDC020951 TaxID=3365104 RepID=UPI0037BCD1CB